MSDAGARDILRLGTRGSRLAVWQTEWIAARLRARVPDLDVRIQVIRTTGDRVTGPLHEVGGKGLFIKEIEEALLADEVDAGIHSLKDLPAQLPEGLAIGAVPEREDPRDALIGSFGGGIAGLPRGARVGTGSLRRKALLRHLRPDLEIVDLRGNVETRLGRWRSGELDAVVLAMAGLRRLGIELAEIQPLSPEIFVPAIGQGALAIEISPANRWWPTVTGLGHEPSRRSATAERAFLCGVGGDCKTPIAAHAVISGTLLDLRALIADPSGTRVVEGRTRGGSDRGEELGRALAEELLNRGGREILGELTR